MSIDYNKIDRDALSIPKSNKYKIDQLAIKLAKDYRTDEEKMRSFYTWIIHNLTYDTNAFKNGNKRINHSPQEVLDRRSAVCYGFSQLFQSLCSEASIPNHIVTGYSRQRGVIPKNRDKQDHAWSAVKLDGKWYLMDLTWDNAKIKHGESPTYLADPELFIKEHLPADPMWQLQTCKISKANFESKNFDPDDCLSNHNLLVEWERKSSIKQKIESSKRAYEFHPVLYNQNEYIASIMEYHHLLDDRAFSMQETSQLDSLYELYTTMLDLCDQAAKIGPLLSTQQESCATTHLNVAVTIHNSSVLNGSQDTRRNSSRKAIVHLNTAKQILENLPSNLFTQNTLDYCDTMLQELRRN